MSTPYATVTIDREQPMPAELADKLQSVEIHTGGERASLALLRFEMQQAPTGDWLPLDHELLTPGRELSIDLAVSGREPQVAFFGHISHLRPHFEGLEDNCYLELVALDSAGLLDIEDKVRIFPDATDSEAAEQILADANIGAEVVETATRHLESEQALIQRGSDWSFLQQLARRNGYVCYFEAAPESREPRAYFGPPRYDSEPQADLLATTAEANLEWFDAQLRYLAPTRHVGATIDPIHKLLVRSEDEGEGASMGSESIAARIDSALGPLGVEHPIQMIDDPQIAGAALQAQASARTRVARFGLLEARGRLDTAMYGGLLRPWRSVTVRAVGEILSGTWWVDAVHTVLDEGRLTQTFSLSRDALSPRGDEEFGRTAEEANQ